jgi:hypothetical protein
VHLLHLFLHAFSLSTRDSLSPKLLGSPSRVCAVASAIYQNKHLVPLQVTLTLCGSTTQDVELETHLRGALGLAWGGGLRPSVSAAGWIGAGSTILYDLQYQYLHNYI